MEVIVVKFLVYFVILILFLIGNGCIFLVIYKNKNFRRNINFFVFNMVVFDFFNLLIIMFVYFVMIILGFLFWKVDNLWILGNILCKFCYFFFDVFFIVFIESLLLILVDRFIVVVFLLKVRYFLMKVYLICIVCIWIIVIVVYVFYFYIFRLFFYGNEFY